MNTVDFIRDYELTPADLVSWVKTHKTLKEVWELCTNPHWLLWILSELKRGTKAYREAENKDRKEALKDPNLDLYISTYELARQKFEEVRKDLYNTVWVNSINECYPVDFFSADSIRKWGSVYNRIYYEVRDHFYQKMVDAIKNSGQPFGP